MNVEAYEITFTCYLDRRARRSSVSMTNLSVPSTTLMWATTEHRSGPVACYLVKKWGSALPLV